MKTIAAAVLLAAMLPAAADNYHRGYMRSDGTYVQPHMQSDPNQYRFDNYSGRDNINPYTGERGSQRHEFTSPPQFNIQNYDPPPLRDPYYRGRQSRYPKPSW